MKQVMPTLMALFLGLFIAGGVAQAEMTDVTEQTDRTLQIDVKNIDEGDYYLDILVKQKDRPEEELANKERSSLKDTPLYRYDTDGEKAFYLRNEVREGSLRGTYNMGSKRGKHLFKGWDLPSSFKVIIQDKEGNLMVTDKIKVTKRDALVVVNYETGTIREKNRDWVQALKYFLVIPLFVIGLKLLISYPYGFTFKKMIIGLNLIAQAVLFYGLHLFSYSASNVLILGAMAVFYAGVTLAEIIVYRQLYEADTRSLVMYGALTGVVALGFTFLQATPLF